MAAPYSKDLRLKVLAAYARGLATKHIAETFSVSRSWARRVKQRHREHGETEARPMGGSRPRIDRRRLAELVTEQPDATLAELRERLGAACSISGIDAALKALGMSFKKRRSTRRNRIVRTWWSGEGNGVRGPGS
jgi:transposase